MTTPDRKTRRFPIHWQWTLCIGSVMALFSLTAMAGDETDDDTADEAPVDVVPLRRLEIEILQLKNSIANTTNLSTRIDAMMRARLAFVDRICGLTDAQRAKLQLAVRGDKKRLIGRIEDIAAQLDLAEDDPEKLQELVQQSRLLHGSISKPGSRVTSAYFLKTLERQLTAEQALKYAPLRSIFREGGLIQVQQRGGDDVVEINLAGTTLSDDDLEHLGAWPKSLMLVTLNLSGTNVTDAGLAHMNGLAHLRELDLSNTRISDAGLANLKGLTTLKHLYLRGLNEILSDEAAYELKRALPKVELHW